MESWSYVSEGKGCISDEMNSPTSSLARNKDSLMGWEFKNPCNNFSSSSMLAAPGQPVDSHGFGEMGFSEMMGKQLHENPVCDVLSSKVIGGRIMNPAVNSSTGFLGEDESTSKLSCSIVDSNSRDSSFIDLKLGRFGDQRDIRSYKLSKGVPVLSSSESSMPSKRVRASGLNSQTYFCQVYGCNKDLSSCKDYHKRHKVCEVHSKTAKVIVNGIEQRFCQQCSRFHLLAEFDEGKRSCRKRLAGHNERRRKPQVAINSGRAGRFLQSYNASRLQGTTLTTSFICQELLPNGLLHPDKCGTHDWCRTVKVEDKNEYVALSAVHVPNGHLHSKSFISPYDIETQISPFHDNGANVAAANMFKENSNQYPLSVGGVNSNSRPFFTNSSSLGSDYFGVFSAASTDRLSGLSDSGCALSLLSSQSQNSSTHSSAIPVARPLVLLDGHNNHYNMSQVSEKLMGVSSQVSVSGVSSKFNLPGLNAAEGCTLGPMLASGTSDAVSYDITDRIFHGSNLADGGEGGQTIDLLQLSSQLQRVEHQRQAMQVKQESNAFCCLRIT